MAIEKRNFLGGLNSDTEDRLMPNGDYRYALNIRGSKSDGANEGSIENVKGNKILEVILPNGTNRVIGSYNNKVRNAVYYFMYNSLGNHTIYEFDIKTSTINIILRTSLLKFKSNNYINDPAMVGDLLFFNDRVNPPRSINVVRAKNNGYPIPFKEQYINQVVYPPGKSPVTEWGNDTTVSTNNVRGKLFQFRTKFVYLDNEESAWSPISKVSVPVDESLYRPFDYYPLTLNNLINVEFELGDAYVSKVKIAVREGNTGDFYLAEEIDKSKITAQAANQLTYTYKFYNNESYVPLDNDGNTGMRLFDNVPLLSDSQELIDGNRMAHGGITEGFDPVNIDIDINVTRGTSVQGAAPVISKIKPYDTYDGFGVNPSTGYTSPQSQQNYLRIINGQTYRLTALQKQEYRPGIQSTAVGIPQSSIFLSTFSAGDIRDRAMIFENQNTGKQIAAGGSVLNEAIIQDPTSIGIRYVLIVAVRYWDIGYTDSPKTKTFKLQYTSVAGDTAYSVVENFRTRLAGITYTDNKVKVKFDKTQNATWVFNTNSSVSGSDRNLQIWGEAYIPGADKDLDPSQYPFPVSAGADTSALYTMSYSLIGYADWTLENKRSLKAGATHGLGLVYYDEANRSGLTNVMVEKSFYVPYFSEISIPNGSNPNETQLKLTINHTPPSWAKRYQVVYTGNQTVANIPASEGYRGFVQFKIAGVTSSSVPGAIEADISTIIGYNDQIPEDVDLGYSFSKGDRIRFITDAVNSSNNTYNYLNKYTDVEMLSYDSITGKITFKKPDITVVDNQIVEIYTPRKTVDEVRYYEVGEVYDIVDGFHLGNTANQSANNSAVIDFEDFGDIYMRYRVSPITALIEDYSYSDFYISDSWDKGRPNKVDNNIKRIKRDATIRFSNAFIPDTNINGLSRFDDFDSEQYDQSNGSIQRMFSKDKGLIVFQELKVGNIRIGQDTLYSNEGTQVGTVKSQNTVLSDIVYYSDEYGISRNPESFAVYGNRLYFTDVNRGAVLRLGGDGITPISEYSMHNYFSDTFDRIINTNKDYKVFGVYDVRFSEYVISIQENVLEIPDQNTNSKPVDSEIIKGNGSGVSVGLTTGDASSIPGSGSLDSLSTGSTTVGDSLSTTDTSVQLVESESVTNSVSTSLEVGSGSDLVLIEYTSETLAFSEYKKRWVTFYSYAPEYMVSNNIGLLTFNNGQIYKHNLNDTYNNFYGSQYTSIIEFLSNVEPSVQKIYTNIFIEATHKFAVPLAANQYGQKTSLIEDDFVDNQGVWASEFFRDENTPNVTNPLIEGEEMKCHSMDIKIENSDTELVKIFEVGIGVVVSQLTNR